LVVFSWLDKDLLPPGVASAFALTTGACAFGGALFSNNTALTAHVAGLLVGGAVACIVKASQGSIRV
jgi:membrane associated rhomboid family serine protease